MSEGLVERVAGCFADDLDLCAARAAIATVLDWLEFPTTEAVEAGQAIDGTITAEFVWQAILRQSRKEAIGDE